MRQERAAARQQRRAVQAAYALLVTRSARQRGAGDLEGALTSAEEAIALDGEMASAHAAAANALESEAVRAERSRVASAEWLRASECAAATRGPMTPSSHAILSLVHTFLLRSQVQLRRGAPLAA